ncbi:MAG: hypothetical protein LBE67_07945 [Kocuria palustris]|jgi:hypothetical protein|nr:hypothetical protein [Kocuria palustris]
MKKEMSSKNGNGEIEMEIEMEIELGGCLSFSLLSFSPSPLSLVKHHLNILSPPSGRSGVKGKKKKIISVFRYLDILIFPEIGEELVMSEEYLPRHLSLAD